MSTTQLSPTPVFRAEDNNGNPLYNGQLFTYAAGTSTPQTTYTDSTGTTPNTNPVILNSRGECNLWLNPSLGYKLVLEDSAGNLIWTVDNVQAPLVQIPYGVSSGTNTILLNTSPSFGSLTDGLLIEFKAANTTTAAATLNANSTGTLNIYLSDGVTQVHAGQIVANNIYLAVYNSSLNSSAGGWILVNPSVGDYAATAGTNTITASITGFSAYYDGLTVRLKMANTTTAAATLNINSIGALNLYYSDTTTALVAGALIQNGIYTFIYDSSLNSSAGGWICLNPSRVTGSFTGTIATGLTTTPTGTVTYAIGQDGKTAYVAFPAITGTASGSVTTMTMTGIPPVLVTSISQRVWCLTEDNTTFPTAVTSLITNTSTTWNFAINLAGTGGYTLGGTKGVLACQTSFPLS